MPLSPYVAKFREAFGHDLMHLPSVCALIWDAQGRVLLGREPISAKWGTIGGAVELGESPQVAALREAREECGVEIALRGVAAVVGGPRYQVTYDNGDLVEYVAVIFDAEIVGGAIGPDREEVAELRWFTRADAMRLDLFPFSRSLFDDLAWGAVE
jgi:8-oxo-dGTP pyrophosphatase MutT (NUDIX family)